MKFAGILIAIVILSQVLAADAFIVSLLCQLGGALLLDGINALINRNGPSTQVVGLSESSIRAITDVTDAAINEAFLDKYMADGTAILSSIDFYLPRTNQYNRTECGNVVAKFDVDRTLRAIENTRGVLIHLSSDVFGITTAESIQFYTALLLAFGKEHIRILRDALTAVSSSSPGSRMSLVQAMMTEIEVVQSQLQLDARRQLEVLKDMRNRTIPLLAPLFRMKSETNGKGCPARRYRYYAERQKDMSLSGNWERFAQSGWCRVCGVNGDSCGSERSQMAASIASETNIANADKYIAANLNNTIGSPEYAANMAALQVIVDTPIGQLG